MPTTLTATFDYEHGFVKVIAAGVPAGYHIYRMSPRAVGGTQKIPALNYSVDSSDQTAADYLVPLGAYVLYGVKKNESDSDIASLFSFGLRTPAGVAYLRHLFYPALSQRIRVVEFNDRRPSRLTTYAISGQRNAMATWDLRGGRESSLQIAVAGKAERDHLELLLNSGAPISLSMCDGLGNDPGVFAVGDVDFARFGKKDRWVVTLALTEIDMPRILGYLSSMDIPGATYDDRALELGGPGKTYNDAAAKWGFYWRATG